jgi:hypothetical protein
MLGCVFNTVFLFIQGDSEISLEKNAVIGDNKL